MPDNQHRGAERSWGPWKLNQEARELDLDPSADVDCQHYPINLDRLYSSAETLDMICQVAAKDWATSATVAGLVWALSDILDPQANLCPWAADRRLTDSDIRRLVTQYSEAL